MRLRFQSSPARIVALATVALLLAELSVCASAAESMIDPASAVRGSLGVSLEELGLSSHLGKLALFLNGGFGVLFGLFAVIVGRNRSKRMASSKSPTERGGELQGAESPRRATFSSPPANVGTK